MKYEEPRLELILLMESEMIATLVSQPYEDKGDSGVFDPDPDMGPLY